MTDYEQSAPSGLARCLQPRARRENKTEKREERQEDQREKAEMEFKKGHKDRDRNRTKALHGERVDKEAADCGRQ
jgi:hypothetical protein